MNRLEVHHPAVSGQAPAGGGGKPAGFIFYGGGRRSPLRLAERRGAAFCGQLLDKTDTFLETSEARTGMW